MQNMWDSNAPLQLLNNMPKKLGKENLEKLQMVIDADKYKNSLISGFDLCGMYAPFCRGCKKTSIYPCAIAYVNMMKANGMDVEIDARPINGAENNLYNSEHKNTAETAQATNENLQVRAEEKIAVVEEAAVIAISESVTAKEDTLQNKQFTEAEPVYKEPVSELHAEPPVRKRIKIAVARKKIN